MNLILDQLRFAGAWLVIHVLPAGLVLVAGVFVARLANRSLKAALDRSRIADDALVQSFFLRSVSISVITLAALTALSMIGLDVRTFIAGLGITGIILGFGLRDTFSNLAAGLLLLIYRPFRAGEVIEVESSQGVVTELTIVNMQMITTDGVRVIMPNSKVWAAKIVNYSRSNQRRLELNLRVREIDAETARAAILSCLAEDSRILKTPEPSVRITAIARHAACLTIWAWTDPSDFTSAGADEYLSLRAALVKVDVIVL